MRALVTGGASSGKSAFAEQLALALPQPHVYVATMRHGGAETEARIKRHRRMRAGKGFATVELAETPEAFAPGAGTVLLEDLSNLVVNDCTHLLPRLLANDNVVVVANEIGADGVLYDAYTSDFIAQVGALACGIAAKCDLVVEVVAGQPIVMKGALPASVSVVGRATPQVSRLS